MHHVPEGDRPRRSASLSEYPRLRRPRIAAWIMVSSASICPPGVTPTTAPPASPGSLSSNSRVRSWSIMITRTVSRVVRGRSAGFDGEHSCVRSQQRTRLPLGTSRRPPAVTRRSTSGLGIREPVERLTGGGAADGGVASRLALNRRKASGGPCMPESDAVLTAERDHLGRVAGGTAADARAHCRLGRRSAATTSPPSTSGRRCTAGCRRCATTRPCRCSSAGSTTTTSWAPSRTRPSTSAAATSPARPAASRW